MSLKAYVWAWAQPVKPATQKLLLLAIADRADEFNTAYPSIDRIAKDTGLNKKTVQTGIAKLIEAGYVVDTGERKGPTKRVRVLRLPLNVEIKTENSETDKTPRPIGHYVYKTVDPKTGEFYIGLHHGKRINDYYLGSGGWVLTHQDRARLQVEILGVFETRQEAADYEVEVIRANFDNPNCRNLTDKREAIPSNRFPNEPVFTNQTTPISEGNDPNFTDKQPQFRGAESPNNHPIEPIKYIGSSATEIAPAAPTKKPAKTYSEEFEIAWSLYPTRDGSNPKNKAFASWSARLSEGVSLESLINGTRNYRAHCDARGKTGTEFVMQATRFFGPGREFDNHWSANNDNKQNTRDGRGTPRRSLSAIERVRIANGMDPKTGEFLDEQPSQPFDDGAIDAEFWSHG